MAGSSLIKAIDSHHHLWDTAKGDYSWMTPAHEPINRIFEPEDLAPELERAAVDGTLLVQTWSSIDETAEFLKIAEQNDFIVGVVGWVDMTKKTVANDLDRLLAMPEGRWLKGIRHQVHDEKDENWLLRDDVLLALEKISELKLGYDLLIRPREMTASLSVVKLFPELRFVIDHIAKPNIAKNEIDEWYEKLAAFKEHRNHVWCKLSGMVTEAKWDEWSEEQFHPYIDKVLQIFTPNRTMIGSDWPVCTLAASYQQTMAIVRKYIKHLPTSDQQQILRGAATAAYQLD